METGDPQWAQGRPPAEPPHRPPPLPRRPRSLRARVGLAVLKLAILGLFLGIVGGAAVGAAAWSYFSRGLPDIPSLDRYRPPIVTEVISADGQLAGEFFADAGLAHLDQQLFCPLE